MFEIIMGLIGIIVLFVMLIVVGIGIAVGVAAGLTATGLLGLGVISSSILVGLRTGKPSHGIRAFLLQCGVAAGIPSGLFGAGLAELFLGTGIGWPIYAVGAAIGALTGIAVALIADANWRWIHSRVLRKLAMINSRRLKPNR
jgi:hypothetical protein